MAYAVRFTDSAEREFLGLPFAVRRRMEPRISALGKNPRPPGFRKLSAQKGLYRIQLGDYRVLYEIRNKILLVLVVKIGHRSQVYR